MTLMSLKCQMSNRYLIISKKKNLLFPGCSLSKHSLSQSLTVIGYFEVENNTRALHNIESIGKLLLLEGILTELKNSTKESLCLQHESALLPSAFARHCSALVCTALHCRGRVCALSFRSNAAFCLDVCPV